MIRAGVLFLPLLILVHGCSSETQGERPQLQQLAPTDIRSGTAFLTEDTRALQQDAFANPGYLWVDRGQSLFNANLAAAPACADCHSDPDTSLSGVATSYPKIDDTTGSLVNVEGRINQCRTQHQGAAALAYESDDLLALTAYVANLSQGRPHRVDTTGPAAPYYAAGQRYFESPRGQFNLSCHTCHTQNWGKRLRGDTISQGHGNGFPAYRFEWQNLGSLHRRFRDCDTGVRAEPLDYGSETYIALELYLAARSNDLELEAPAVRR